MQLISKTALGMTARSDRVVAVGDTVYCELRHATKYKVRVVNGFGWLQPLARLSFC